MGKRRRFGDDQPVTRATRLWLIVGTAALALAAVDAVANAVSNHQGLVWAVVTPLAGLAFVSAGLLVWVLRPDSASGRLLVLVGAVFMVLTSLWAANDPLLYTLGNSLG